MHVPLYHYYLVAVECCILMLLLTMYGVSYGGYLNIEMNGNNLSKLSYLVLVWSHNIMLCIEMG